MCYYHSHVTTSCVWNMTSACCHCSTSDSHVVLVFELPLTPTCVNRTTLLVDDSDRRSLTDHCLDNNTTVNLLSSFNCCAPQSTLRASRSIQLSEEFLYNSWVYVGSSDRAKCFVSINVWLSWQQSVWAGHRSSTGFRIISDPKP